MQNTIIVADATTISSLLEQAISAHVSALRADVLAAIREQQRPEKRYLTRAETAKLLRLTLPTLNKRLRNGQIQFERSGRRVLIPAEQFETKKTSATQI